MGSAVSCQFVSHVILISLEVGDIRCMIVHQRTFGEPSRWSSMRLVANTITADGQLFRRLTPTLTPHLPRSFLPTDPSSTVFTHTPPDSVPVLSDDRPALIVSSTSWTADEDFSLLLTALDSYQTSLTQNPSLPRLLVVITGKGDLRSSFERAVAIREADLWKDVAVRCIFLPARDYPTLLGCADLGVSLHTSSSGQDLPMKVVDMFGCGVPVLAKRFLCVGELVKDGQNGLVFDTGEELGLQMIVGITDSALRSLS